MVAITEATFPTVVTAMLRTLWLSRSLAPRSPRGVLQSVHNLRVVARMPEEQEREEIVAA